jgi:hypothetical protein
LDLPYDIFALLVINTKALQNQQIKEEECPSCGALLLEIAK